jgi:hypothetical protein
MATLIISKPISFDKQCDTNYDQFKKNRIAKSYSKNEQRAIDKAKKRFKKEVIDLLCPPNTNGSKKDIFLGEYHIFNIAELKALIEMSPEADYIHIYNGLNEKNYNMLYAIPVNSSANQNKIAGPDKEVITNTSLLLEAFPCPPDPRCRNKNEIK